MSAGAPSDHFPPDIRAALIRAAQTPIDEDSLARVKAINSVIERAKLMFPHLFKEEPCES